MAILELKNVSYRYDEDILALNGVSIAIAAGEKIAVLGNNGAGKTTFFQICNGLLSPHSGEVWHRRQLATQKRRDVLALRKDVSIVFQDADNQIIAPTVESEISFGPMNLGYSEDDVRALVEGALDDLHLGALRDRPPHYLSGGEKKTVSIADALVMNPQIMLMDEPTASLDPANSLRFEALLEQLHEKGIALVIASHDVDFAWRWAQRIVVFHDGEIIADDVPEKVFCDWDMLRAANLRQPVLYEIQNIIQREGDSNFLIKTVADYREFMQKSILLSSGGQSFKKD